MIDSTLGITSARADALREPRRHQHRRRGGDAAGGGGEREQREADRERQPAADPVTDPRRRDQEHGRGQRESGDDPFDRTAAGVQVVLHRGQRDVDDEEVEDDHEGPYQQDRERRPAVGADRRGAQARGDGECG